MVTVGVNRAHIEETAFALRQYGREGFEGLVLWLGEKNSDSSIVTNVMVPPQTPIRSESGVGYLVSGDTMFELNKHLHERSLRLIAQIHSHPGRAYHSEMDDKYAIATKEGSYSIVVPDFAMGEANLHKWVVYQLRRGRWIELGKKEVQRYFSVTGDKSSDFQSPEKKKKWWNWW